MIIVNCLQIFFQGGYLTYAFLLMFFFGLIFNVTRCIR